VGKVSLFKVLSGTLRPDDHLTNSRTGGDERLHGLLTVRGKEQEPASELVAGDIGAVAKLTGTATGDTLAPRGKPVVVRPIEQPEPNLAVAVVPKTQADEDKLAPALHRLQEEDPSLVVERIDETHQTLLKGTGETHLQITMEKLTRKFGANVETEPVRVPYRETITGDATRSRPAATGSSACASSTSSRCRGVPASSSRTTSWAAPSPGATSRPCRRASTRPCTPAGCTAIRWST
jgi:elongation factor G